MSVCCGVRVKIPFGPRTTIGVVVAIKEDTPIEKSKLKSVLQVLDNQSLFSQNLFKLLEWASTYYFCSLGQMIFLALPVALRKGDAGSTLFYEKYSLVKGAKIERITPLQSKIIESLGADGLSIELFNALDLNKDSLKRLIVRDIIKKERLTTSFDLSWQQGFTLNETPHDLNIEQKIAVTSINSELTYSCFLLEGITGSGKTEVYLQAIANTLSLGRQVLVLVPEIGLTPQTIARFRNRFNVPIVLVHSTLTKVQKLKAWILASNGAAAIIIGTRSAIFTPMLSPGLIILDEEHDLSFKQFDGVKYSARDLGVMRAYIENIPIVLGSATPSLESLYNVQLNRYKYLELKHRAGSASLVKQIVLDITNQPLRTGLSKPLLDAMKIHLDRGSQVLLFLNKRGFAPILICHECGYIHECKRCNTPYSVHVESKEIKCHRCDTKKMLPRQCHECGSTLLTTRGIGTEQLETALASEFADYPIIRIDRDTTTRKGSLDSHLEGINAGKYKILIGTQMLAKGHHFPDVTLVAVLNVDGAMFSSDFRATERFGQLYTQVAGRSGRGDKKGIVMLQTYQAKNPLLLDLIGNGYNIFARNLLASRIDARLPPFRYMVLLRAQSTKVERPKIFLNKAKELLDGLEVMGPIPAGQEKRANYYRFSLFIQGENRLLLQDKITNLLPILQQIPESRGCIWYFDRDPQDLS